MSKTVLGRNLAALLRGAKVRGPAATRRTLDVANAETIGPGLRTLLKSIEAEGALPKPGDGPKEPRIHLDCFAAIPAWYFFGADLALLFLAAGLVWPAAAAPGTGKIVLAGMAVLLGALLSIAPFYRALRSTVRGRTSVT
jgi:hypothetical protein